MFGTIGNTFIWWKQLVVKMEIFIKQTCERNWKIKGFEIIYECVESIIGKMVIHNSYTSKINSWIDICANKNINLHNYIIQI